MDANKTSIRSEGTQVAVLHDLAPPPFPLLTILATVVLLFLFVSLVSLVYYYSNKLDVATPVVSGEQKLAEHQASQKEQVASYGYDKATNSVKVPVDVAVQKLVSIGFGSQNDNMGKLPFPMKSVPKTEVKSETIPAPKEAAKDVPKETPKEAPKDSPKTDAKK